jgi:DNA repair protein RadC
MESHVYEIEEEASREEFCFSNIKCLSNQELLQTLLSNKAKASDLKKLAKSFETFKELFFADADRLKAIDGIDEKTVRLLLCAREIIERSAQEKLKDHPAIKSLRGVLDYCGTTMSALSTEQLRVLFLNGQNMLLFDSVEDYGSVNTIAIYNRNIIKKALILKATAVILVHNHPSRSIRPSRNDVSSTKALASTAKQLDIHILDHIIIGGNDHFSMKERGMI